MVFPVIPVVSEVFGLLRSWIQGRQKIQEATDERRATLIKQEGDWDSIMAQASVTSWKDEWLTILFSIPLIGAFIPNAVPTIRAGFAVLESMPDWYRYTLSVIVAASFGVRSVIGTLKAHAELQAAKAG